MQWHSFFKNVSTLRVGHRTQAKGRVSELGATTTVTVRSSSQIGPTAQFTRYGIIFYEHLAPSHSGGGASPAAANGHPECHHNTASHSRARSKAGKAEQRQNKVLYFRTSNIY